MTPARFSDIQFDPRSLDQLLSELALKEKKKRKDFGPPVVTNSLFDFQRQFLESKKDNSIAGREKKMNKKNTV